MRSRRSAGFSMVELLVSIALMSVMTAVLLQTFIVARRLNARTSTEQRLQTLAESSMESMKGAELSLVSLAETAKTGGFLEIDGISWRAESAGDAVRLVYNDIGNGRAPVMSFGRRYGVYCEIDPSPYGERARANSRGGRELVTSFNSWPMSAVLPGEREGRALVQLRVVVYRMEGSADRSGAEQLRLESARLIGRGAG